ncbi:MAG: 5-(carboxyamino)imidazole ribonucleotide mutase [Thermoplasmatales archaeon]
MPSVSIIMGSKNDWEYMKECASVLDEFNVDYEKKVISAHRTPDFMREYAMNGRSRGIKVIIAGAGGAAHLPGMTSSYTTIPVIGVPIPSKSLNGIDSLLSIVQMPYGIPVATVAIGGAKNAALLAIRILSLGSEELRVKLERFAEKMMEDVLSTTL